MTRQLLAVLLCSVFGQSLLAAPFTFLATDRMLYAPTLVAKELGYWKQRGIDIRAGLAADDEDLFQRVRVNFRRYGRRACDFGACRAGDLAYMRAGGLDIEPIAFIGSDRGRTQFVTRKGLHTKDLKNRKIACDLQTVNLYFLAGELKKAGLKLSDVQLIDQLDMNNPRPFVAGEVAAIVIDLPGAKRCLKAGRIAGTSASSPIDHVLFVKSWVKKQQPELIQKFLAGYQQAQTWMRNPANEPKLAKIIDQHYYWIKYQTNAKPLGTDFVRAELAGFQLRPSIQLAGLPVQSAQAMAFMQQRARQLRSGDISLSQTRSKRPRTGSAFDNAVAWWRFAGPYDFQNCGSAGAALDLVARGSEKRPRLFAIGDGDYYHAQRTWTFRGFQNDGFGWSTDGIAKYLTTLHPKAGHNLLSSDFTIWLRCSNRNTRNTVLFGQGALESDRGLTILYQTAAKRPTIACMVHGKPPVTLRLPNLPFQQYLDVSIRYSASQRRLQGMVYETPTGKQVASAKLTLPKALRPAKSRLTIGGNAEHNTNKPLHGAIENVAVWTRVLKDSEIMVLTRGPAKATRSIKSSRRSLSNTKTTLWHNVRDYGAVGDGKHDDTAALQAAIDDCIVAVTIRDKRTGRWVGLPDRPPKPGHAYAGTVFVPPGVYRTTRPLVLRPNVRVVGDVSSRPFINSEAEVGLVFWNGAWNHRKVDFKVRSGVDRNTSGVRLENLHVRANRFGLHTMGVPANAFRMRRCRLEGPEAGFVCTGFMMFSQIYDCEFEPAFWMLTRQGTRFNTSTIKKITIGLHGTKFKKWGMRLEGCIQCVKLSEITLEVREKGIFLDSYAAGVSIDINNLWNFDAHGRGVPEVLRVVNGRGVSISNVMALDYPSTIFVGKNVRHVKLDSVLAKSITIEDPKKTKAVFINVPNKKYRGDGSVIEDDVGGVKKNNAGQ